MNVPSLRTWIAGTVQVAHGHTWSLRGVYTTEQKAKQACTGENDFYGLTSVDEFDGEGTVVPFEAIVFPHRKTKE